MFIGAQVKFICKVSPNTYSDCLATFISTNYITLFLAESIFQSLFPHRSTKMDYANKINSLHANYFLDLRNSYKVVGLRLNVLIIIALYYCGTRIKNKTKVILDTRVPHVCQFDLAIREKEAFALLQYFIKFVNCFFEKCYLDLAPECITEFDVHKVSFTSSIVPVSSIIFFGNPSLNYPVISVACQSCYWRVFCKIVMVCLRWGLSIVLRRTFTLFSTTALS